MRGMVQPSWRSLTIALLLAITTMSRLLGQGIVLETRSPSALRLDSILLAQATAGADRLPALTSLLVWRAGALGYEEYFHGGARDVPVNVKSVSKSLLSALVGMAIESGQIKSLDQPV